MDGLKPGTPLCTPIAAHACLLIPVAEARPDIAANACLPVAEARPEAPRFACAIARAASHRQICLSLGNPSPRSTPGTWDNDIHVSRHYVNNDAAHAGIFGRGASNMLLRFFA